VKEEEEVGLVQLVRTTTGLPKCCYFTRGYYCIESGKFCWTF